MKSNLIPGCCNIPNVQGKKVCVNCTVRLKFMSVPSRYECVLVLRHPIEEDSGTYKIVASAGKAQSEEFSFKLDVKGDVPSMFCAK